jgi:hypothetical protein
MKQVSRIFNPKCPCCVERMELEKSDRSSLIIEKYFVESHQDAWEVLRNARFNKFPNKVYFSLKTSITFFVSLENGVGISLFDIANSSCAGIPSQIKDLSFGVVEIEYLK